MSKTVIGIEQFIDVQGNPHFSLRIKEPSNVPDAENTFELPCNPENPPFKELADVPLGQAIPGPLVRTVGQEVFTSLQVHPGVVAALNLAVSGSPTQAWPIFIDTTAVDSESLPWESLYHPQNGFMALNDRWPIARVTGGLPDDQPRRPLQLPLCIAAVLAAESRDATPEWHALLAAVKATQLPCKLKLLVAQDDLKTAIENTPGIDADVSLVPPSKDELINRLVGFRAHILHIFAHGSNVDGYLEVATRNTRDLADKPLFVASRDLLRLSESVWLVVLNACQGGAPALDAHSMAFTLVHDGIPAAIGMREIVDSKDAHVFCEAFYTEALRGIHAGTSQGGDFIVPWAAWMRAPRDKLCAQHGGPPPVVAEGHKEWTLPVLYQRRGVFSVEVPVSTAAGGDRATQESLAAELEVLLAVKDRLHPDTPGYKRVAIEQRFEFLQDTLYGE